MARKKKNTTETTEEEILNPKEKALQLALKKIEKDIGKEAIIVGDEPLPDIDWFSSGSLSLNKALTGTYDKGYPRGRIIEIWGPESSGKTTLCLHAVAEMQKLGETVAFIDAEHALDHTYASNLGVDMSKVLLSQPDNGEQALDIAETLVKSGALGLIVIDSVAALTPKAEIEGEMGSSHMGLQARLMSQAMRKLVGACMKTKTTIIFINQIRMKIGIMFGNPETTTGGNALKFYASQRLCVRRTGGIKEKEGEQGFIANTTKVQVAKNKVARPFRVAEFNIKYGEGIDIIQDFLAVAVKNEIVNLAGSWYSYGDIKLGQGEANTIATLKEQPELLKEIQSKL